MSTGVVLVANNIESQDYVKLAIYTAKRVRQFLNLPVTLITDKFSVTKDTYNYFDEIKVLELEALNYRQKRIWSNKGRYRVYNSSPYDTTLLLDVDYLINSDRLLSLLENDNDFLCFKNTFYFNDKSYTELLSTNSIPTLWATVIKFQKTEKVKQIFEMMKMVQENYDHYSDIYRFMPYTYRNDYALTIALKTINGHIENYTDYIPYSLCHVGVNNRIERVDNTTYKIYDKENKSYIKVSNMDFHVLNKRDFEGLINE
jgi:hypothetical protein